MWPKWSGHTRIREYVYHFVRQSYREDGKVKHRTLANLSHLPGEEIELVRRALAGDHDALAAAEGPLETRFSLPHGHVAAVLGAARGIGLHTASGTQVRPAARPGYGDDRRAPPVSRPPSSRHRRAAATRRSVKNSAWARWTNTTSMVPCVGC